MFSLSPVSVFALSRSLAIRHIVNFLGLACYLTAAVRIYDRGFYILCLISSLPIVGLLSFTRETIPYKQDPTRIGLVIQRRYQGA